MKLENTLSLRKKVEEEIKGMGIDEAMIYIDTNYEFIDEETRQNFICDMLETIC